VDPWRREHVIYVVLVSPWLSAHRPKLGNSPKLVLSQVVVLVNKCVHIRFESSRCVQVVCREPQLDVVFRVRANYEVDVVPICKQSPLDVAYCFRQMLPINFAKTVITV